MDNDPIRNGRPSLHREHGPSAAVLSGDAMIALAFGVLGRRSLPAEASVVLSETVVAMCAGQLAEQDGSSRWAAICDQKTGSLFSAAARLGVLAAGHREDLMPAAHRFGCLMGRLYQLRDDHEDGDPIPQDLGFCADDLRAGLLAITHGLADPQPLLTFLGSVSSHLGH